MIMGYIFNVAPIRAGDLARTVGFYIGALPHIEVPRAAGPSFPGAWLGLPGSGIAMLHVHAQSLQRVARN